MKTRPNAISAVFAAFAMLILLGATGTTAALLDVDINGYRDSEGPTQPDFDGWAIENGTASAVSQSFGSIDVTITAVGATTFTARNRGFLF